VDRDSFSSETYKDIADALAAWQQGDCALEVSGFIYRFKTTRPVTPESRSAGNESDLIEVEAPGFVVMTQTCDILRAVPDRPYIDICALVACPDWTRMKEIEKGLRPRFAFVPGVADRGIVADLDQVMTIEKPLLASWRRLRGCGTDTQMRAFAAAISRKFSRFAFPDDFVAVSNNLVDAIRHKHGKPESEEGKALRELREIRVAATPDWSAANIQLQFFFIRHATQNSALRQPWDHWLRKWLALVPPTGRYVSIDGLVLPLSRMQADEYIASDQLDLDHLTPASPAR
jgi:hypothetical protein